jgi:hypothetical protein
MYKIFLIIALGVSTLSCKKPLTKSALQRQIEGIWIMKEAKLNGMNSWEAMPSTEAPVVITEDHISNPWNKNYEVISKNSIALGSEEIKVEICKKDKMLFSLNGDSLKFERQ